MFTGIIQGLAVVMMIHKNHQLYTLQLKFPLLLLNNLKIGASVSNNGCCLTVTKIQKDNVYFDIIQETLKLTNLSILRIGSTVNIERSLCFGDEIGGHLLSGHIITTATIHNVIHFKSQKRFFLNIDDIRIMKYIFRKGFIAIDGISLTINTVFKNTICVDLIPETISCTNIGSRKIGEKVNIEVDYYTHIMIDNMKRILNKKFI
ncbi:riboflavin synthase subunit alpha [Buchnera aphidicola]|uniref:riboflavin synthase subunit alpha n=1 Tax=Buchnera aphidicola TaxID=9 RepID=UPI0034642B3A